MDQRTERDASAARDTAAVTTGGCCRICGSNDLAIVAAREMMFGTRAKFDYLECADCGCLQIARYPAEIAEYYPSNYYAYSTPSDAPQPSSVLTRLRKLVAWRVQLLSPRARRRFLAAPSTLRWLAAHPVPALYARHVPHVGARILDVGCGAGELLKNLRVLHYQRAIGADPFVPAPIYHDGTLLVRKSAIHELGGQFDCISFHHVLEHMPDQHAVLAQARNLLAPNGIVLIRIPTVEGAVWRKYRQDWPQLDAPRHFYLHSERSLTLIAAKAGMSVRSIEYDSTGFQFWGAELLRRDIPLIDPRSPATAGPSMFSSDELAEFDREAIALNTDRKGDQFVAILAPIKASGFSHT